MLRSRQHARSEDPPVSLPTSMSWPLLAPPSRSPLPESNHIQRSLDLQRVRRIKLRVVTGLLILAISTCFVGTLLFKSNAGDFYLRTETASQPETTASLPYISRGWQPRAVDRYILEKLELLSQSDNDSDNLSDGPRYEAYKERRRTPAGVPIVDRIPEGTYHNDFPERHMRLHRSQQRTDGHPTGRKFLLPSWIGEQESKARLHFLQLAQLAHALNRTLILPHVARGRMGSCMKLPLGFYYAVGDIPNSIALADFVSHYAAVGGLSASIVIIDHKTPEKSHSEITIQDLEHATFFIDIYGNPSKSRHSHCLEDRVPFLRFRAYSPLWIIPSQPQWSQSPTLSGNFADDVTTALASDGILSLIVRDSDAIEVAKQPDVLVVNWELRHPIFQNTMLASLEYAPRWSKLAADLTRQLSPFLAVHWRMETIEADVLQNCAASLISTLKMHLSLPENTDLQMVYLATDFPLADESRPRSGTFGAVKGEQRKAINEILSAFETDGELGRWQISYLEQELDKMEGSKSWKRDSLANLDLGLMGIVDKKVLMSAEIFITAHHHCGKPSSYTRQVIETRTLAGLEVTRNIVDLFGNI